MAWPNLSSVWRGAPPANAREAGTAKVPAGTADAEDVEARWLRAAPSFAKWRNWIPNGPVPMERFKSEATEESWHDARKFFWTACRPKAKTCVLYT